MAFLIVRPAARRTILAEAKREGIDLTSVTRPAGVGGKQVIDWEALVEAIDQKKQVKS